MSEPREYEYRVRIITTMEGWVEVSAANEEQAKRAAREGVSCGDLYFDGDCMSIDAEYAMRAEPAEESRP
jgi:hypothetical protein